METRGIIISGLPCSGKSVLCEKLNIEYGWPVHSIGQMWREKWKLEYPNGEIAFPDWWRKTSDQDNILVNEEMMSEMKRKSLIVDSRYTPFYCLDLPYLRVFLDADLETRARRVLDRHNQNLEKGIEREQRTLEQVREILKTRGEDEYQRGFVLFKEDYRNPAFYQLKIDSSNMSISQELESIKNVITLLG